MSADARIITHEDWIERHKIIVGSITVAVLLIFGFIGVALST